jgi:hypothetical protein
MLGRQTRAQRRSRVQASFVSESTAAITGALVMGERLAELEIVAVAGAIAPTQAVRKSVLSSKPMRDMQGRLV